MLVLVERDLFVPPVSSWLSVKQQVTCVGMKATDSKTLEKKILSHHVPGYVSDTVETGDGLKSSLAFACPPATALTCRDLMDYLDFLTSFVECLTFNVMGDFPNPSPLLVRAPL